TPLADVAYTLTVGRTHFPYRRAVVCADIPGAIDLLSKKMESIPAVDEAHHLVFMFPGQGSQYPAMGSELFETQPVFRAALTRCEEILAPLLHLDLIKILYGDDPGNPKIYETALTQPVIFCIEYALAQLLISWGLKPQSMIGHSVGEYVAACLAGVFSLEDALSLVAWRGRLMQEMVSGAMLSIPLPEEEVIPLLNQDLSMAAVNGPSACVVSGPVPAIEALREQLKTKAINTVRLPVSHAFHSLMMEPMLGRFEEKIRGIKLSAPQIPYLSNETGTWISVNQATSWDYWVTHLRNTVRFSDGAAKLLEIGRATLIEVGGGRTLTGFIQEYPAYRPGEHLVLPAMRHPKEPGSDVYYLLTMIGKLWRHGIPLDWEGFYAVRRGKRISLPTYPFERRRFWIDGNPSLLPNKTPDGAGQSRFQKKPARDWFYLPSWKRKLLIISGRATNPQPGLGCCLVFKGNHPLSLKIAGQLRTDPVELIMVQPGPGYAVVESNVYSINPESRTDYETLFRELKRQDKFPQKIIHLWSISNSTITKKDQDRDLDTRPWDTGFYSVLYLAKAINQTNPGSPVQLFIVSNDTQAITGAEKIRPEKAVMLGPCKVIPQEFPDISCRYIDLLLPKPDSREEGRLLSLLFNEFSIDGADPVVAYRDSQRWVEIFEPLPFGNTGLHGTGSSAAPSFRLREKGIYLITGGLGRIGMIIARDLAETCRARLILTGRSTLPDRSEWEDRLATCDPNDPLNRKIRGIKELETLGSEVSLVADDLSSPKHLEGIIRRVEKRWGPVNGVIHAAGIMDSQTIQRITKADCEKYFQAKVYGLMTLYQVFEDRELDFCMLMSSLAATLGGLGFVAYAAANLYMDAFTQQLHQKNKTGWISVNWDGWRFNNHPEPDLMEAEAAKLAITPEEGLKAFHCLLEFSDLPQIIISTGDLTARYDKWVKMEDAKLFEPAAEKKTVPAHRRPDLTNPYAGPRNETEKKLAEIWQEVLGFGDLGIDDSFFELGGHSLKATVLTSRIHKAFNLELPLQKVFESPTIRGQAEYLNQAARNIYVSIQPVTAWPSYPENCYPVSSAQKRLYILNEIEGAGTSYNMPGATIIEGELDRVKLEAAFAGLVERHEAFRTSFELINGEPAQRVHSTVDFKMDYQATDETGIAGIIHDFIQPFDLRLAPLLRVCLLKLSPRKHILIYDMSHIICDGVSTRILIQELMALYIGANLPKLRIQYKDYAVWQNELLNGGRIKEQEEYWIHRFSDEIPVLNLPEDYPRPALQSFEGDRIEFEAGPEIQNQIHALNLKTGTTLYMALLAAYNILLAKYTGRGDVIVGSPSAGRPHADMENIIGMFVNTLAMRNYPADHKQVLEFLGEVKANSLEAYANQDYQFEVLIEKLNLERDLSRNPLFDVMFVLQNQLEESDLDV
ncbi:MAG TPA: SDR family NAD(P)-dependent oxidoreductase, partial [Bacillota bacterium]|nr:SDR family NAD(P)-dependent oxidoreductase [Bacillota bacterium]